MKYDKPPLSFEEQADKLLKRGLLADKATLIQCLENVNYYRFSGYLYPYRQLDDTFRPGTTFEKIWRHYTFDRRLRLVVMDAIERIEVSIRTRLIYSIAHESKAFGYTDRQRFPHLFDDEYARLIATIQAEASRSTEKFVAHFFEKYGDSHGDLPLWMAGEIMPFGSTLMMYKGVDERIRQQIAGFYGIPEPVLTSWLKAINAIRNICAHHNRLWNREIDTPIFIPRKSKYPQWHSPVSVLMPVKLQRQVLVSEIPEIVQRLSIFFHDIGNDFLVCRDDMATRMKTERLTENAKRKLVLITTPPQRVFLILTIAMFFLKQVAPRSKWKGHLFKLLHDYPEISRWSMGFPDNWKACPIWQ